MRWICFFVLVAVGLVLAAFLYQNPQTLSLTVLDRTWTAPAVQVLALTYLLGMFTGWSVVAIFRRLLTRATDVRQRTVHV